MSNAKLTVLSFGAGQDSTDLLYRYIYDPSFKEKYAPNDFIVINSDTGNEHRETLEHIYETEALCKKHGIEFYHLTNDMGYHYEKWMTLKRFYKRSNACGSKCFPKTCTDKLKLQPIYKFLEVFISNKYGLDLGRKKAFYQFAEKYGKINMLIGISKGEENRICDPEKEPKLWKKKSVNMLYPLIDLQIDRKGCQDSIKSFGYKIPMPSNCIICPFMNLVELLWLYRFLPEDYREWVEIEHNKIKANSINGDLTKTMNSKGDIVDNMGVWGKKLLPEKLDEAIAKHGHMTDAELSEYKMSHGHCVKSKY